VDDHCVLVFQCHGKKTWQLGHDCDAIPAHQRLPLLYSQRWIPDQSQPPVRTVQLTAGDVLYLPRGVVHSATTAFDVVVDKTNDTKVETAATSTIPKVRENDNDEGKGSLNIEGSSLHLTFGIEVEPSLTIGAALHHLSHLIIIQLCPQFFDRIIMSHHERKNDRNNKSSISYADLFHLHLSHFRTTQTFQGNLGGSSYGDSHNEMGGILRRSNPRLISRHLYDAANHDIDWLATLMKCCHIMIHTSPVSYQRPSDTNTLLAFAWPPSCEALEHITWSRQWISTTSTATHERETLSDANVLRDDILALMHPANDESESQNTTTLTPTPILTDAANVTKRWLTLLAQLISVVSRLQVNSDSTSITNVMATVDEDQRQIRDAMSRRRSHSLRFFQTLN
jgi:hypothetical protein